MILAAAPSPRRRTTTSRSRDARLVAEVEAMLSREIWFVPSKRFKQMDSDDVGRLQPTASASAKVAPATEAATFLSTLCRTPLLSPTDERELFCRMNYLNYRANCLRSRLSPDSPDREVLTTIKRLLEESLAIRNRIVEANVRLVMSIVKQFADQRNRFDDLFSEGMNCLIKAVEKFDFDRGFRFSTYATRAVRREVFRLVQRHHRDRGRFSSGSDEILHSQIQRDDSPNGILATWSQLDASVQQLLGELDEREKFIVSARFGFEDVGEKPTFQRLGEMLGVSKERARQLEQRAIQKMRLVTDSLHLESTFDEGA